MPLVTISAITSTATSCHDSVLSGLATSSLSNVSRSPTVSPTVSIPRSRTAVFFVLTMVFSRCGRDVLWMFGQIFSILRRRLWFIHPALSGVMILFVPGTLRWRVLTRRKMFE